MQRKYIDCNSLIGRTRVHDSRFSYKEEELIKEMEYYRIHKALVFNQMAKEYSYIKGNKEIIETSLKNENILGVASVLPHIKYELDEGIGYLDFLVKNNIKAFKVAPKSMGYKFLPYVMEEIVGFMIEKKIPMMMDNGEADYEDIAKVLKAFPNLNLLLLNTSWGSNRELFPLLDECENLYFDISSNQANNILENTKKFFGINRVLFGTNYPYKTIGALKSLIEYSSLSEEDKDTVAFKNAMNLFKIKENDVKLYPENRCEFDEIACIVDKGLPLLSENVIDSHTHMVEEKDRMTSDYYMPQGDEHHYIKKMDKMGVDKMITAPWEGISTDGLSSNDTVIKAMKNYPGRIEGFACCNPNYIEDLEGVIPKYHMKHRFVGIKPYWPYHKYDILGEKYSEWFEYANKHNLLMLMHSGTKETADKVLDLSKKYPNISYIMAHSGSSYEAADYNIAIAKKRDNIYLEITYTAVTNGIIEYMVKELGADRILYGSDLPMRDPAPQLGWVCYSRISLEEKRKILGLNIEKLIKRCIVNC